MLTFLLPRRLRLHCRFSMSWVTLSPCIYQLNKGLPMLWRVMRMMLGGVVALIVLFEEWGWQPLAQMLARLGRLPLWALLEQSIRRLPPYASLAVLGVPVLLLLPVKLLPLHWLARGHVAQSIALLVLAKLGGTALVARLFQLTQPSLMRLQWFATWFPRWMAWKALWFERIRASHAWRMGRLARRKAVRLMARFRALGARIEPD